MIRKQVVFEVVACAALAALTSVAACSSSTGPASCSALYNCCVNTYDPSSCQETASDETDAAVCAAALAVDVEQGLCLPDGAAVPVHNAGVPVDAGHG